MKKTLLTLLAAGALAPAFAQVGMKNSFLLYGSGTYSSSRGEQTVSGLGSNSTQDEPRILSYSVSPGIGYQFTDNLTVGVNFSIIGGKIDYRDTSNSVEQERLRAINVGPFVRYTQMLGDRFFFFAQANFGYVSGKNRTEFNGSPDFEIEDDFNGVNANFFPAIGVRVSPSVALSFAVGGVDYNYLRYDLGQPVGSPLDVEGKTSAFDLTFGQQFNFTLQKYFGGNASRGSRMPMDETRRMDTSDDEEETPRRRRSRDMDDE